MPATYSYPGVYVEEIPSGVRPIAGVSTSDTAFIGFFRRGPMLTPTKVTSFAEFERTFGGFDAETEAAYQVASYFANGGGVAWIVRSAAGGGTSSPNKATKTFDNLVINAKSEGAWGNNLRVEINHQVGADFPGHFNVRVEERTKVGTPQEEAVATEFHRNLSMDPALPRYALNIINNDSLLVEAVHSGDKSRPAVAAATALANGRDGTLPDDTKWKAGIAALDAIAPAVFNLLCLAGAAEGVGQTGRLSDSAYKSVVDEAIAYCERHRALVIVDPPSGTDDAVEMAAFRNASAKCPRPSANAAIYFPRLNVPDSLQGGLPRNIGPSGAVAGAAARTDATRGVWKAPAGTDVGLGGGSPQIELDDTRTGDLNILGVNVIRSLPIYGTVVWGARTMKGADADASEWKYLPVRRMALYLEESLYQGLKWVVFEPNDEPLWSSIRLNVTGFMDGLFRQGAFAGTTPRDAFFVRCDKDTTTEADVNRGICNILVGFRPLKPAEFVVLKIQQKAGQPAS